jgi:hypothetical protein
MMVHTVCLLRMSMCADVPLCIAAMHLGDTAAVVCCCYSVVMLATTPLGSCEVQSASSSS